MNTVYTLLLLATAAFAVGPDDFLPCAFEAMTITHVYSGGSELTTSIDALYRDHDNLWRWDSEFNGLPGLYDGHEWSVIWRPDDDVSYHEFILEKKCLVNNGGKKMYPFPYEWIESKTKGITWTRSTGKYEEKDVVIYSGVAEGKQYKFTGTANFFFAKNGQFLFANGTIENNLIDVTFEISVTKFQAHTALNPAVFIPSAVTCPSTTMPANATKDFQDYCYREPTLSSEGAVSMKPSLLFFLATLLAALMIIM